MALFIALGLCLPVQFSGIAAAKGCVKIKLKESAGCKIISKGRRFNKKDGNISAYLNPNP